MKKRVLNLYRWLIAAMGFGTFATGCEAIREFINPVCMYGTPHMDYAISGKVVDKAGNPLKGIEVGHGFGDWLDAADTTGADGKFNLIGSAFPDDTLHIRLRDIDIATDGAYEEKVETVTLNQVEKSEDAWYRGKYEAKDITVELTSM